MRNLKRLTPSAYGERSAGRWALISTAVMVAVAGSILGFLLLRDEGGVAGTAATLPVPPATTRATSTTVEPRDEVVARLRQIFRIRDRAIETRNHRLLEGIYSVDCPCLQGDGDLIRRLRRDGLVWRGIKVSLQVEDVERVSDRLWTVNAVVVASPFRIEKETGAVVQQMPEGRELSRFALTKPGGTGEWLLGQASFVERRD